MILIPVSVCFDIILFLLFRRMKLDKQMYEIKFKNQILRTWYIKHLREAKIEGAR